MSYVCEHCVKRVGLSRATMYHTVEELHEHLRRAHPPRSTHPTAEDIQESLTGNRNPGTPVPLRVPLERLVDQLLDYCRNRAVPGPAGKDYRDVLTRARELGLVGR